jgi:hypothetical protein
MLGIDMFDGRMIYTVLKEVSRQPASAQASPAAKAVTTRSWMPTMKNVFEVGSVETTLKLS